MANYLNCIYFFFCILIAEPGYAFNDLRIVGGDPVKIEEVPFFAIYKPSDRKYGCGATIVSERFLLSSAHCYHFMKKFNNTVIVVGTDKIDEGEYYDILEAYPHPNTEKEADSDVVVIKLAKDLVFSSKVQPIQMAEPDMKIEDGSVFKVMGFGATDPKEHRKSTVLLQVNMPYVNMKDCNEIFGIITPRMICAGEKGKGVCFGDSGGPLIFQNKHIGIVSFCGSDCSTKGTPTVFARVSALRGFIDEHLAK